MELSVLEDKFAKHLQIEVLEMRAGYARARMRVQAQHLNGLNFTHGGVVFTVADYAFALAANTLEETGLGINTSVNFIKASQLGDELVAEAKEVSRSRRLATYQIAVTNQQGALLAQVQAMAYLQKIAKE